MECDHPDVAQSTPDAPLDQVGGRLERSGVAVESDSNDDEEEVDEASSKRRTKSLPLSMSNVIANADKLTDL